MLFCIKIKNMKKLFYSFVIVLSIMTIACKKDDAVSINGFWTVTGMNDGSSSSVPVSFLYKGTNTARGYLLTVDTTASANGDGTYSIDPDSVRTTIIIASKTIIFTGKLNSTNNQMNGRFVNITSPVAGSFTLTKN